MYFCTDFRRNFHFLNKDLSDEITGETIVYVSVFGAPRVYIIDINIYVNFLFTYHTQGTKVTREDVPSMSD